MRPTVIIHTLENGAFDVLAHGDVRVVWVDDSGIEERVFEQLDRVTAERLEAVLQGAPLTPNQAQALHARHNPGLRVVR